MPVGAGRPGLITLVVLLGCRVHGSAISMLQADIKLCGVDRRGMREVLAIGLYYTITIEEVYLESISKVPFVTHALAR
eukprot:648951-Pleurochrysis_carterae.AAC.1